MNWKTISYNIAAVVNERGKARKIIGQAMGAREDGQFFYAAVGLPWVWGAGYTWTPAALRRLNSFLNPKCKCRADETETATCKAHRRLLRWWERDDRRRSAPEGDTFAVEAPPPGPTTQNYPMHRDYPWLRYEIGNRFHFFCTLCGARSIGNVDALWRNKFIIKHSGCGGGKLIEGGLPFPKEHLNSFICEAEQKMFRGEITNGQFAYLCAAAKALLLNDYSFADVQGLDVSRRPAPAQLPEAKATADELPKLMDELDKLIREAED